MIVVAIISIIAAISIPNLLAARLSTNEVAAVVTLRNLYAAQEQFQMLVRVDGNENGLGEYGGVLEMSGAVQGRMTRLMNPPVLSGAWRVANARGEVARSGYFFRVFLPGSGGVGVGEGQKGFGGTALDADLCDDYWCAYAWPVNYNQSGNRTFFINQLGEVVATESSTYSGTGSGPAADAAFSPEDKGKITGRPAASAPGVDGNRWRAVN